jgi:hypothetical protein
MRCSIMLCEYALLPPNSLLPLLTTILTGPGTCPHQIKIARKILEQQG